MIEEVLTGLYRIEIPLPGSPLKWLNSYLIRGDGRYLLVDTGWNRAECRDAMLSALTKLGVNLARTDFVITHHHSDHAGLLLSLAGDKAAIYFNQGDMVDINDLTDMSRRAAREQRLFRVYQDNGFPAEEIRRSAAVRPGRNYGLSRPIGFQTVKDGDTFQIGEYTFRCVDTPGHSHGHMCLYEPARKVLLAGDHILDEITPNITFSLVVADPLRQYLASLEKVNQLDIKLALPGHRRIIDRVRGRIAELQAHHRARLDEVHAALEEGDKTAFQVAPYISWDIDGSWATFSPYLRWFAFGETLAHLDYMAQLGVCRRKTGNGTVLFSLLK